MLNGKPDGGKKEVEMRSNTKNTLSLRKTLTSGENTYGEVGIELLFTGKRADPKKGQKGVNLAARPGEENHIAIRRERKLKSYTRGWPRVRTIGGQKRLDQVGENRSKRVLGEAKKALLRAQEKKSEAKKWILGGRRQGGKKKFSRKKRSTLSYGSIARPFPNREKRQLKSRRTAEEQQRKFELTA